MVNALIYTRVSTDKQEYKRQIYELKQVAEKENYNLLGVFSEKISGATKSNERTEFNNLKSFIETSNQKINIVITWEISRFGRSFIDAINTVYYFINKGINVYTHKEKLFAFDDDGNLNSGFNVMLSLLADFAEKERVTMQERSKSGIKYKVYNGGQNNGVASGNSIPFGYNNSNKILTINENEAQTVKEIFKMFLNGVNVPQIAKHLNLNNVKAKRKLWGTASIYKILRNRIYIGERLFNDEYLKADSLKIIPKTTFNKVELIFSNKTNKKAINQTYINPLQGLIYCVECGLIYRHKIHNKSHSINYVCSSNMYYYRNIECDNVGVNIPFLNSLVYEHIRNNQMQIKDVNKQLQDVNNQINNLTILVNNLKQDLKKFEKQENNLLELRLNDSVTLDLYNSKLERINKDRDKAEKELNQNNNKLIELKQFKKKVKNSKSIKLDVNTFKDNIKQLVKRIEIKRFEGEINGKPIKDWFNTRTFQVTLQFIDGNKSVYVCGQNNWLPFKKPKNSNKYFVHPIPKYFSTSDFIPEQKNPAK